MPRRCATCGEPRPSDAAFCGRCGARTGDPLRSPVSRATVAAERSGPRRAWRRPSARQVLAATVTAGVLGLFVSGLEVDDAAGEVALPQSAAGEAPPTPRPSPTPAPDLAWCRDGPPAPLCMTWRRARPQGPPVLADDTRVVVAERDGALTALDRATGAPLWQSFPPVGEARTGVLAGGTVLLVTRDGRGEAGVVAAMDSDAGHARWTAPAATDAEIHASGDLAIVVGPDHLVRLDLRTGEERWRWPTSAPGGPALVTGSIAAPVVTSGSELVALDPASGSVRWSASVPRLRGAALTGPERLVAVAGDGRMVGLDAGTGSVDWDVRLAFNDRSAVRVHGAPGLALVAIDSPDTRGGARTSRLVAIDPATGEVRWVHLYLSRTDRQAVQLTPTAALLVGTTSPGTVAALDLDSGLVRWQRDLGDDPAHARVVGRRVVAASGRDVVLLTGDKGREIAAGRSDAPILGFVWSDEASAVLRTTTGVTAVELLTAG